MDDKCIWKVCTQKADESRYFCSWHQMIYNKRRQDEAENLELDATILDERIDYPEE